MVKNCVMCKVKSEYCGGKEVILAPTKIRLDKLLYEKGLVTSRQKAQALIMSGQVLLNGQKITKAGKEVSLEASIKILQPELKYVSRGGLKLEKALQEFKIEVQDKICIDIGASTGGFTDCLLQHGARLVYAVDVGYGQLDWKLRQDKRVINIEKTNIRYFGRNELERIIKHEYGRISTSRQHLADLWPSLATVDVSFISLEKVLPTVKELLPAGGEIIMLIKPQFEAGRGKVGKGGVVKDEKVRIEVLEKIKKLARDLGLRIKGLIPSPIKGPAGNIEYLMYLVFTEKVSSNTDVADKSSTIIRLNPLFNLSESVLKRGFFSSNYLSF